jgi:hypothetical protein
VILDLNFAQLVNRVNTVLILFLLLISAVKSLAAMVGVAYCLLLDRVFLLTVRVTHVRCLRVVELG